MKFQRRGYESLQSALPLSLFLAEEQELVQKAEIAIREQFAALVNPAALSFSGIVTPDLTGCWISDEIIMLEAVTSDGETHEALSPSAASLDHPGRFEPQVVTYTMRGQGMQKTRL